MSYQVLARRWRPQRFEELRGQEHVVRALTNALRSGRVAHAYLFSGIRGVGKTSAARILAKALNCEKGPAPEPCNACAPCEEITAGTHPDVFEIDGASNTGVDDVRRLREGVRYPPVRGGYRVYIIDEVHMLSTAAFNALLKTLEEPPPHVVFVFATTDPHKVPPTIRSRCQQYDFRRLSRKELVAILERLVSAEGVEADPRGLAAIAREAEGSVRDAQSLLDQVMSYTGGGVTLEGVRDVLGTMDRDLLLGMARDVLRRDPGAVLKGVDAAWRYGADPVRLAQDLLEVFRDLCVLAAVGEGDGLVDLAPEEAEEARGVLQGVSWEEVHARFEMLAQGLEGMRRSLRPDLVLEMTLLKAAQLPPLVRVAEIVERAGTRPASRPAPAGGTARPGPGGRPEPEAPSAPPPGPAGSAAPGEPATAAWNRALDAVRGRNRAVWSVLKEHARLAAWEPEAGRAVVEVDPEHLFFAREKKPILEGALGEGAGRRVVVEVRAPERGGSGGRPTDRGRRLRREALEHPLIREALEMFDGTVEAVRVLKP